MAHQPELGDPQQQQLQQQEHQSYQGFYSDLAPPSSSSVAITSSHQLAPLQLEHNHSFSDEMDSYLLGSPTTAQVTGTSSPPADGTLATAHTPSSPSPSLSTPSSAEVTSLQPQASELPLSATAARSFSNASSISTTSNGCLPTSLSPQIEEERLQGEGQLQEVHSSQGQGVPDQQHMRPLTTTGTTATQSQEEAPSPNLASSSYPSPSSSSFSSSPALPPLPFQQPHFDSIDSNMSVQYQQQPCHAYPAPPHGYDVPLSDIVSSLDIQQQHYQQPQDDGLPALHRISLSDSGPVASFPHQQSLTRNFSQPPLMIPANDTFLNPIPAKSEDWAALVDTPASPIQAHSTSRMGPPFQQIPYPQPGPYPRHNSGLPPSMSNGGVFGYTDSPAPEQGGEDYLQHGQVQSVDPQAQGTLQSSASLSHRPPLHANTDPTPMGQNYPHSQHQHHKSFSGSGPSDNLYSNNNPSHMAIPPNRQANRKSWSPNSIDSGVDANSFHNSHNSQGGYLTPPRRFDTNGGGSPRSMGHGKQGSVATSVSLLTDAAIVAKYRETAIKTNDASIQLSYAKYLLDIGEAPAPAGEDNSPPRNTPSPPTSSPTPGSPTDEGNGKKQLALEAIYWIDRLAKEGQPEAQFIRGTWYEDGIYNSKKNADKALKWFQSASKGDYGPAHYKVGFYCEKKKDNNKAVMLYKKAAIHNDVPANHRLAMVYLYGEMGQSKNMKAGLQYLKRAASFATESCPMAPYVLGLILAREYKQLAIPDDVAFPDDGEALEWFKKSASLGYGPANYKLGYCYEYGTLGCVIDPFLSVKHYERAVMAGDGNGEAEMALSGWYLSGAENCFPAQDHLAFQYAAKAAEKKLPKAEYAMGYYYEVGISIPADMQKAMEFYQQAAANGNKEAQTRLTEQASAFDKLGHKNSIRRIKQGRNAKDNNCIVM